jgi:hypothetical protein
MNWLSLKIISHHDMKFSILSILFFIPWTLSAQLLPGFKVSDIFDEQQMLIENSPADTRILINAPIKGFERVGFNDEWIAIKNDGARVKKFGC